MEVPFLYYNSSFTQHKLDFFVCCELLHQTSIQHLADCTCLFRTLRIPNLVLWENLPSFILPNHSKTLSPCNLLSCLLPQCFQHLFVKKLPTSFAPFVKYGFAYQFLYRKVLLDIVYDFCLIHNL